MSIWMKNSNDKPDAVLTMTFMGFVVILVKLLLVGVTVTIGEKTVSLGDLDAGLVGAMLTPTLGAYVARRWTDKRYPEGDPANEGEDV